MRGVSHRQLFLRRIAPVLVVCLAALNLRATAAQGADLAGELRAAKIITTAVLGENGSGAHEAALKKVAVVYDDIIRRNPRSAEARNDYAEFLWTTAQHEQAVTQWEKAQQIAPNDAALCDALGAARLSMGHTRQGVLSLQRAAELEPASAYYHHKLGNAIYLFRKDLIGAIAPDENGVLETALRHLREASKLEPENLRYASGYAETFYGIPNPDWNAALAAWEQVLRISENKDFARAQLARVNLKLGRRDAARELVSKIQDPQFQAAKRRLMRQIDPQAIENKDVMPNSGSH